MINLKKGRNIVEIYAAMSLSELALKHKDLTYKATCMEREVAAKQSFVNAMDKFNRDIFTLKQNYSTVDEELKSIKQTLLNEIKYLQSEIVFYRRLLKVIVALIEFKG